VKSLGNWENDFLGQTPRKKDAAINASRGGATQWRVPTSRWRPSLTMISWLLLSPSSPRTRGDAPFFNRFCLMTPSPTPLCRTRTQHAHAARARARTHISSLLSVSTGVCSDLSAITKKFVRGILEKQFALEEGALDSRRSEINGYIESAIEACMEPEDDAEKDDALAGDEEAQVTKKKKGGWGFVDVTPQLRAVIGEGDVSRGDIIHRIWKHIKEHNLQDPKDKRFILCDAALKQIFKSGRVSMFKMNKELTRHIWKPEKELPAKPAVSSAKKSPSKTPQKTISKKETSSKASSAAKDKKKVKASSSSLEEPKKLNGLQQPKPLAAKLAEFMGTKQASRLDVNKKIWEHIKSKSLQSAENKSIINCDSRLKDLLGQDSVSFELDSACGHIITHFIPAVHIIFAQQVLESAFFERLDLYLFRSLLLCNVQRL
jgi:chromatin remodeling complex protein RSC6